MGECEQDLSGSEQGKMIGFDVALLTFWILFVNILLTVFIEGKESVFTFGCILLPYT